MSDSTDSISTGSTMPDDPIPPYTFHLWFPWSDGGCQYLLRYTREHMGETNETGFVLEPIGENRCALHQKLMEDSLDMAIRDLHNHLGYCPDKLYAIAELIAEDMKGRIVAINDPEIPPSSSVIIY